MPTSTPGTVGAAENVVEVAVGVLAPEVRRMRAAAAAKWCSRRRIAACCRAALLILSQTTPGLVRSSAGYRDSPNRHDLRLEAGEPVVFVKQKKTKNWVGESKFCRLPTTWVCRRRAVPLSRVLPAQPHGHQERA